MKEWFKEHALEIAAIVISLGGAKGLFDFWTRLLEMFGTYPVEASFACVLSAAVAAIAIAFAMRRSERRKLTAKDAEIAAMPSSEDIGDMRRKLASYEDERVRMVETIRNYPFFRREALRYACERSGVFMVDRDGRLSSELEVLEEEGLVRRTHQWANCAEWTTTVKGESAWRDYEAEWGETISGDDQVVFQSDTYDTKPHEMKHLDKWVKQAVLLLRDHPHQVCSERYRDTLFNSIPRWMYEFSFDDGSFDLTPEAYEIVEGIFPDDERRLYERVVKEKLASQTALDAVAAEIEIDCAKRGVDVDKSRL